MDKPDSLEQLVRENRFTISVVFPLFGAIGFVASAEGFLPEILAFNPLMVIFGTLVMRLPLISGIKPLIDVNSGLAILSLTLYAYVIEFIGIQTGFPYGEFSYGVELGPMVYGIPVGLPVFFIPLVLNSVLFISLFEVKGFVKNVFGSLAALLAVDSVLDPAAVSLGIWNYSGGFFYGVPLSNFAGWILSGTVSILVLKSALDTGRLSERLENTDYFLDDMVSFVFLWGVVNLYYMNIIPVIVAVLFGAVLYRNDRFNLAISELDMV